MKKSLLVALLTILCLTLVLTFTACGGGGNEGGECVEHSYGEWTLVKSATCDAKGSEKRVCSACQAEETRETEALGHDWNDWKTVTALTCTVDGKQTRSCKNCTETEDKTLVHLGHNYVDIVPSKAPSAIEDGNSAGSKCSECEEVFKESLVYHKFKNVANKAEWSVTNGNANFWAIDWNRLLDGDIRTGTNSPKGGNYFINMDYENPMYLDDFYIVCNGYGKYMPGAGETTTDTYNVKKLKIVLYEIESVDEATGEPMFKEVFATELIDTSNLLSVKLSEYGYDTVKKISRIGINIQEGVHNGTEYLYEVEVSGSTLITVCDNQGCDWSDWTVTKEPECSKEALTNGEETRTCSRCKKEEKKSIPASHNWSEYVEFEEASCGTEGSKGRYCLDCDKNDELVIIPMPYDHSFSEWYGENYSCTEGGTLTRTCQNEGCGFVDSKFAEPGQHVNVTVEGYKEPTTEEDGATGVATCDSCGTVISENRVISKIVNVTSTAKVEMLDDFWGTNSAGGTLIDGNPNTGAGNSTKITTHSVRVIFAEKAKVNKLVFVVNSTGSIKDLGNCETLTNNDYKLYFKLFVDTGKVEIIDDKEVKIYDVVYTSVDYYTVDQETIVVELGDGIEADMIEVYRYKQEYGASTNCTLWEITALAGGKIVEE